MKPFKMSSLSRLVSFVLIAVLLLCVVGFAAGGQQSTPNDEPDSGDVGDNNDETDENKDGVNDNNEDNNEDSPNVDGENKIPDELPVELPKYYNTMTGLEISAEQLSAIPKGFVFNPRMPLYSISSADITLEFPTENGSTRMLSYTTDSSALWKVGSLAPTRSFISHTSSFFGGVVISYGNDDIVKYSAWEASNVNLDLSKISGCYYIENTLYIYTSKDMVDVAADKAQITGTAYKGAPYNFSDTEVIGTTNARSVIIPYSESDEVELYYSDTSGQYLYFKAGARKVDMLNGKNIAFTNVFVLFANSTTYENANGTELVIDNTSGGSGYYISGGYLTEIKWMIDESGTLKFTTLSGEMLSVNRGNAYVAYYKASNASSVTVG